MKVFSLEKPKESTRQLLELLSEFNEAVEYRAHTQNNRMRRWGEKVPVVQQYHQRPKFFQNFHIANDCVAPRGHLMTDSSKHRTSRKEHPKARAKREDMVLPCVHL